MAIWKKRIYADAAAAAPLSPLARREFLRLLGHYENPGALHRGAVAAKDALEDARAMVAAAIGAHADEVVFTASGTEANNLALLGLLRPMTQEGSEVHAVTSAIEHASVLLPLRSLEPEGVYVTELPVSEAGTVTAADVREAINEDTRLVSVQLINSEIGTVQPVRDIAKALRAHAKEQGGAKIYLHTDASQAPLWLSLKVDSLGVDMMTLDGQKILGPKGVGALYVRRGTPLEPILFGGGQEGGLRSGTESVALAGAFAVALREAQKNVTVRAERVAAMRDFLAQEIKKHVPDVRVHGPAVPASTDVRAANNLNISIPGLDAQMAVLALDAEGVAASTRSACSTGDDEPSHVLAAIGIAPHLAQTAFRLTLLPTATRGEMKYIARTLATIAKRYKNVV